MNQSSKQEQGTTIIETCESMNQRLHPLALNSGQWKTVKGLYLLEDNFAGRLKGKQASKNLSSSIVSIFSFVDSVFVQSNSSLWRFDIEELDPVTYPSFSVPRQSFYFNYEFGGDQNGLFYWLGTEGKTIPWSNPSPAKTTIALNLVDRTSSGVDIVSPHTWELKNRYYFVLDKISIRGNASSSTNFAIIAKHIETGIDVEILNLSGLNFSSQEWQVFNIPAGLKTPASKYQFTAIPNVKFLEIEFYGSLYLDALNISLSNEFNSLNSWIEDGIRLSAFEKIPLASSISNEFYSLPIEFTSSSEWEENNAYYQATDVLDILFSLQSDFSAGFQFETNQTSVTIQELAL